MNYIITAAGLGTRFLKNGIKPPKPLIKIRGNELILWSLTSFDFKNNDTLFIVTLKKDRVKKRIEKKLKIIYGFLNIFWLELNEVKNGQLLTALEVINHFNIIGPLVIHNCDTSYRIENFNFDQLDQKKIFGAIPYFLSEGNNWSFLKIKDQFIIEIKEKVRISNLCSVGTYYFSDAEIFYNLSLELLKNGGSKNNNEFYIAPLYEFAIKKNYKVLPIKCSDVKLFGNCDELKNTFGVSFFELLSENDYRGHQRKTFVLDIDGTLCGSPSDGNYLSCVPIESVCKKIRFEDSKGSYIILYTSRNMRSFGGNIGLINKHTSTILQSWLKKHCIPYDEIYFGKPWGGDYLSYIDDKMLSIKEFQEI